MNSKASANCRVIVGVLIALALLGLLVSPVLGHGGDDAIAHGPASAWLIAFTYLQLAGAPIIGLWLLREAIAAWWLQTE